MVCDDWKGNEEIGDILKTLEILSTLERQLFAPILF